MANGDYKQSEAYLKATFGEQKWFDVFYETRDIMAATYSAFKMSSDDSAKAYGRVVAKRPHIEQLIKQFCAEDRPFPDRDEIRRMYLNLFEEPNATVSEKLKALASYERLTWPSTAKTSKDSTSDEDFNPLDDLEG